MKIGIFGGTFDPFHAGHYAIVNSALEKKLVDKVIVIPSVVDYYRKDKKTFFDLPARKTIIKRWLEGRSDVILDFSEYILAETWNGINSRRYVDMLQYCIGQYGPNDYYTIIGSDSLYNFKTWHKWQDILKMSKIIAVQRDGASTELNKTVADIDYIPMTIDNQFLSVSASAIRERLDKRYFEYKAGPYMARDAYLEEIDFYKNTGGSYEELERKKLAEFLKPKDEILAHTPIFDLVECPEVEAGFKPVKIKSKDWVTIVVEKDGKFLMEKQLRYGLGKEFEEFPCGMIEDGEYPYVAALRELKEETGIEFKKFTMKYLGKFAANPAFMSNYMHYFHIELKDYTQGKTDLDEHEHIDSYWVDKKQAFANFMKSEGSSIGGCCWMLLIREGIVSEWDD